jgi:hypothetical protein
VPEASTSLRTMAGRTSAICCATKLPMEKPGKSTWPSPFVWFPSCPPLRRTLVV